MKKMHIAFGAVAVAVGLVTVSAKEAAAPIEKTPKPAASVPYLETAKNIQFPKSPKPTRKPVAKAPVNRQESHTSRVAPKPRKPIAKAPQKPRKAFSGVTISGYAWCPSNVQSCIDAGKLTGYNGNYLAGHNYMGYQWLSRVAVGTTVRVTSGPLAGTYRVYGHLHLNRQGGSFPNTGGADLVLQSCEGSGTGFSLARRI